MNIFFVVSQQQDWPHDIPGVTVLTEHTYLNDPACADCTSAIVFNLCHSWRYQSRGYYVSLLAEARGHAPVPGVQAMKELQSGDLVRSVTDRFDDLIDCTLVRVEGDVLDLDIYFGRDAGQHHAHLSKQLFRLLQAPVLHVRFERAHGRWHLCNIYPGSVRDIPLHRQEFARQAATAYLREQRMLAGKRPDTRPSVALLTDPQCPASPSNPQALQKFRDAAAVLGMTAEILTPRDARRLPEFDALFIRDTTNVDHYTYRLSRHAIDAGMIVIDDPDSILRCSNKIYLNELLTRHRIPTPRTLVVHKDNVDSIAATLGLPCVLKQPDGAFSLGVLKIESEQALREKAEDMLRHSDLLLAQEYLPTEFDWRVAVLDRRPLFVCKYYMAPGHWQIIKHEHQSICEGRIETLSVGEAPDEVVDLALRAANLIGDGFYGVDLKQVGAHCCVIEINDNPNVDAGNEDAVLSDALYREVMGVFCKRIEARKGIAAS